ncbi:hypothetical protein [Povalibacter sp.]|uniref:hypothetical protein n=1 Tax=Povalibacter sp. TaxID=1962978 RepID=UPI002F410312
MPSGRILHIQAPPFESDPDDAAGLPSAPRGAVEVVKSFVELDRQVTLLAKDVRFTDAGRNEKLSGPRANAIKTFAVAYESRVLAHEIEVEQQETAFYKLPAFSTENYQRERHILDLLLSAPKDRSSALFAHAMSGDDEEMAVALLRAPKIFDVLWSGQVSGQRMRELGEQGWRNAVEKRDPERAAHVKIAREMNDWGKATFKNLARELREPGKNGVADLIGDELRFNSKLIAQLAGHASGLF